MWKPCNITIHTVLTIAGKERKHCTAVEGNTRYNTQTPIHSVICFGTRYYVKLISLTPHATSEARSILFSTSVSV